MRRRVFYLLHFKLAGGVFVPGGRGGCWVPHQFLTAVLQWLMKQTAMMYQRSVRMQASLKIQWELHRFENTGKKCCACHFPSITGSRQLVMIKVWFLPSFNAVILGDTQETSVFAVCLRLGPNPCYFPAHRQTWDQAEGSDLLPGDRRGVLRPPPQRH